MELTINPLFKNLLPPLSVEEYNSLTESLIEEGCREPLLVWRGQIVDGHNRYEICKEEGIPFSVREMDFPDADAAMDWIDKNQIARRNLSPDDFRLAVGRRYNRMKRKDGGHGDQKSGGQNVRPNQAEVIARDSGVDERTVRRAGKLAEAVEALANNRPDLLEKVAKGTIKGTEALRQMKRDAVSGKAAALPAGKFSVIYADPPWSYNDKMGGTISDSYGAAEKHYPSMTLSELKALDVPALAAENCVLWLWATCPLLEEALELARAWGFRYKAQFVWDKIKHNMGHYNSVRHELLLICTRGSCAPENVKLFDSVQSIERTGHSEKPRQFREIIETLYPSAKKIELFHRGAAPVGWEVWGNESKESFNPPGAAAITG